MERGKRFVLAISPFGISAVDVHSLRDDLFFFGYLVERGREFVFHAPQRSCDQLEKAFPAHRHRLRVLPTTGGLRSLWRLVGKMTVPPGASVVFFGYSEKLAAAFLVRHAFKDFRLTLVATNNFSARRVRLYGAQMRAFLRLARSRLERLVVHTDYELSLVERLDRVARARAMSKRHHLMMAGEVAAFVFDRPVVAFFGPVKPEKPIEPLTALIAADVAGSLEYRVYGLSEVEGQKLKLGASLQTRLMIQTGRLSDEDYAQAVASSNLVLLTHNHDFEGKLSGNLCDCIAHQVPFLGSSIEPHLEYLRRFGAIGYVTDMTKDGWAEEFLQSFTGADLLQRRGKMAAITAAFNREGIYEDLDRCVA